MKYTIAPPIGYCVDRYGTCEDEKCYCQVEESEYYKNEELQIEAKRLTQNYD